MCPLEANWVSAGFAAPGEGQEESQEAGSRSNVERADPRGGTDRAKQMTALRNAIDSLSIVEEAEVSGKKRWGVESRKRKHASHWIRHASHQPWKGIRNIIYLPVLLFVCSTSKGLCAGDQSHLPTGGNYRVAGNRKEGGTGIR